MRALSHITAYRHSEPHRCQIIVQSRKAGEDSQYRVCLQLPDASWCENTNSTIFNALIEIRRQIEPAGWRLGINAARFDAITGTEFNDVFIYLPERQGVWRRHLALDPAPLDEVATVEQQLDYGAWIVKARQGPAHPRLSDRKKWWRHIQELQKN